MFIGHRSVKPLTTEEKTVHLLARALLGAGRLGSWRLDSHRAVGQPL